MAARTGFNTVDRAVQTHGWVGFVHEYHVKHPYRDFRLEKVTPVTDELVKAFIIERELKLPRSY